MFDKKNVAAFSHFLDRHSIAEYGPRLASIAGVLAALPAPTEEDVRTMVSEHIGRSNDRHEHAIAFFTAMLTPGEIPVQPKAKKAPPKKKAKPPMSITALRKLALAFVLSRTPARPEAAPKTTLSKRAKAVLKALDAHTFGCQENAVRQAASALLGENITNPNSFSGFPDRIRQFAAYECPDNDITLVIGPSPDEGYTVFRNDDEGIVGNYQYEGAEDWAVGATEKQIRALLSEMDNTTLRETFDFLDR